MDKKKKLITGLSFGIVMSVFFVIQNLLIKDNQTRDQIIKSVAVGLTAGIVSGFLFGWLMGLFVKSKFLKQSTMIETDPDETILFETPANHFKGLEGVGGKLYLTNKRIVFKSHKWNIQNHQFSLNRTDIKKVDRYKLLGVVNKGLVLTTNSGTTEKFVVEQVENLVNQMENPV